MIGSSNLRWTALVAVLLPGCSGKDITIPTPVGQVEITSPEQAQPPQELPTPNSTVTNTVGQDKAIVINAGGNVYVYPIQSDEETEGENQQDALETPTGPTPENTDGSARLSSEPVATVTTPIQGPAAQPQIERVAGWQERNNPYVSNDEMADIDKQIARQQAVECAQIPLASYTEEEIADIEETCAYWLAQLPAGTPENGTTPSQNTPNTF